MQQPEHPSRLTYEGRRLPRPGEDVVDQGLGFDLATLVGRRQVLRALGLGVGALGLAACGGGSESSPTSTSPGATASPSATTSTATTSTATGEIPEETAGPFPGDGSNGPNVLERSGIVRSDLRSSFGEAPARPRACR